MKLMLYHGTKTKNLIPIYGKGRHENDYGQGFYTSEDLTLAKEWAWSPFTQGETGYVYKYSLDLSNLKVLNFNDHDTLSWLAELLVNRRLNIGEHEEVLKDRVEAVIKKFRIPNIEEYDVIIGWRADDSYFAYMEDFVQGTIYRDVFDQAIKLGDLGEQVFIKSETAFKALQLISIKEVPKYYEKLYDERDKLARSSYKLIREDNINRSRDKKTIDYYL